jgi:hypothetical protein
LIFKSKIQKNTKNTLFAYAGKHCACHNCRLTHEYLFAHEGHSFGDWLMRLLQPENEKKGK